MAIIRLQGKKEISLGIYYEFDTASEPLGEGGMGKVYKGRMVSADGRTKDVAIKFMFDGLPETVIDRARREAGIQIPHENLVEMMGFLATETKGANGESRPHYHVVSELLVGVMLADLLEGVTTTKNGLVIPFAEKLYTMYQEEREKFALTVMKSILSGILCLHDHDYIHRDIDPTNIMVTQDGKIKLIDFGIAKHLNTLATQDKALTSSGQFMGKVQYAPPELVLGDVPNQNKATDIYELGILFYQLVQGHLPFEGSSNSVLNAQIKTKTPVDQIQNPYFANVIAKATEKEPNDRYHSAAEFRVAVEQLEKHIGKKRSIFDKARKFLPYVAVALVVIAVAVGIKKIIYQPDESADTGIVAVKRNLYTNKEVPASFNELIRLKEDPDALYLLSRLYCEDNVSTNLTDSVNVMRLNLSEVMTFNNQKAHKYLLYIEEHFPTYYKALYDLGMDYLNGESRTGGEARDLNLAKKYFAKSRNEAISQGNKAFAKKAQAKLDLFN